MAFIDTLMMKTTIKEEIVIFADIYLLQQRNNNLLLDHTFHHRSIESNLQY